MIALRLTLLAALSLLPAACAAPPSTPRPKAAADASGTWRGTATRFQALSRSCPHPGLVSLLIWDDKFQYRWNASISVDATIAADGTIAGQAPGITLVGKYADGRIDGDVTNGDCGLHFTLVKKDN
jgi:hypothetical protein